MGGSRLGRGTGVVRPRAGDGYTPFRRVWGCPPILFSLSCQRKENAPCTVEEKRERFGPCASALHSSVDRKNLMRGRMDFLLFPRFAHSRVWLGWMVRLTGVSGRFPLPIKRLDGLWRLLEGLRRHFAVPHMSETGLFEILTGFPAISPPRDSFGPFEGNIPRLKNQPSDLSIQSVKC